MAHPLHADLVIANLAEDVPVASRDEVVDVVSAAAGGERQASFFRNDVVKFEFAELEIQPGTVEQVV